MGIGLNGAEDKGATPSGLRCLIFMLLFFVWTQGVPWSADAEEAYRFQRMWPTLQQPWYFSVPMGIVVDKDGNVFVAEHGGRRISKLTADGRFISSWGRTGSAAARLSVVWGMALDDRGNILVADSDASCIRKYSSHGRFLGKWGARGRGDGEFRYPAGVAVDKRGDVYVLDVDNDRIQKFTSRGRFLSKWGRRGDKPGEFKLRSSVNDGRNPWFPGIAIGPGDQIHVVDGGNRRIQKFNSQGQLMGVWGHGGAGKGEFDRPAGIAVDGEGRVYVSDSGNGRIQVFAPDGRHMKSLGSSWNPENPEGLYLPWGLALDSMGNLYLTEPFSPAVRKLAPDGKVLTSWRAGGAGDGQFDYPAATAVDDKGNLYVADYLNCRIQKFTEEGRLVAKWGKYGSGEGEFAFPVGIALHRQGPYVYVVDQSNHRIQRFTRDGVFSGKWGRRGSGPGCFEYPYHAAVDQEGNVYVTDTGNARVQKFNSQGKFLGSWGKYGKKEGEFRWEYFPGDIAADEVGHVYVTDGDNHRVQKFTTQGKVIGHWAQQNEGEGKPGYPNCVTLDEKGRVCVIDWSTPFIDAVVKAKVYSPEGTFQFSWGKPGTNPGQMHFPSSVAVGKDGRVYLADYVLSNLQVFQRTSMESRNKAIILAGGGPYRGNALWPATEMNTNFAYRTLIYQGYTKDRICYLSSDRGLDLDGNGVLDDVDGDATIANLRKAVTHWAKGADDVVIYLADHGGEGAFRVNHQEVLSAEDLAVWCELLEPNIAGRLVIVYDACRSGSFLPVLANRSSGKRVLVASSSSDESAYFANNGSISFSNFFWTHIFNGLDVFHAFRLAGKAMSHTTDFQHPLLDDNGNGKGNEPEDGALAQEVFIGNGADSFNGAPVIGEVSPHQMLRGKDRTLLYAQGVKDPDGIARVWAVIRPPEFKPSPDGSPVCGLPSLDLQPRGKGRFEALAKGFNVSGTYRVAVYAMDRIGNISVPRLTAVSVNAPSNRKAIIVAGGSSSDPLWPAVESSVRFAHEALKYQGYTDEHIRYMGPVTLPGVDQAATAENLRLALEEWVGSSTQDLVLTMVGRGGHGIFDLNGKEELLAADLDVWLDALQARMQGRVTLIYDACNSGSFLPLLTAPAGRQRILVASSQADGPATFLSKGDISFSRFFWNMVANGASVREAFLRAGTSIRYVCPEQVASLDDDGNGVGNERTDGELARNCVIGSGIVLAGDPPVLGRICPGQVLRGRRSCTLWVEEVTATRLVKRIWAVIRPPGSRPVVPAQPVTDLPSLTLHKKGDSPRYEGVYDGFEKTGVYKVTIYAMDETGNVSLPKQTHVSKIEP